MADLEGTFLPSLPPSLSADVGFGNVTCPTQVANVFPRRQPFSLQGARLTHCVSCVSQHWGGGREKPGKILKEDRIWGRGSRFQGSQSIMAGNMVVAE